MSRLEIDVFSMVRTRGGLNDTRQIHVEHLVRADTEIGIGSVGTVRVEKDERHPGWLFVKPVGSGVEVQDLGGQKLADSEYAIGEADPYTAVVFVNGSQGARLSATGESPEELSGAAVPRRPQPPTLPAQVALRLGRE